MSPPPPGSSQFNTVAREEFAHNPSSKEFQYPALQTLTHPHTKSFNAITERCLGDGADADVATGLINLGLEDIGAKSVFDGREGGINGLGNKLTYWVDEVRINRPTVSARDTHSVNRLMLPSECRERLTNYAGRMTVNLCWRVNDGPVKNELHSVGMVPIMVKSNLCNIANMAPRQLIDAGEECEEMGGYFIVNGLEKIIRLLIVTRRNHVSGPLAAEKMNAWVAYQCNALLYNIYLCRS